MKLGANKARFRGGDIYRLVSLMTQFQFNRAKNAMLKRMRDMGVFTYDV